jgi:hypothetical protein
MQVETLWRPLKLTGSLALQPICISEQKLALAYRRYHPLLQILIKIHKFSLNVRNGTLLHPAEFSPIALACYPSESLEDWSQFLQNQVGGFRQYDHPANSVDDLESSQSWKDCLRDFGFRR